MKDDCMFYGYSGNNYTEKDCAIIQINNNIALLVPISPER